MPAKTGDTARLFFALWPTPEVQHALYGVGQQAQRECGGRLIPERNIHMTLVFLGNIGRVLLPQLEAVAAGIVAGPCDLVLDRIQYWRHNGIVWAGVEQCPAAIPGLVSALSRPLRGIGLEIDTRPYVPHITLLREARRAPAASGMTEVAWPVLDFALIESVTHERGRAYEVLRRWPLRNV